MKFEDIEQYMHDEHLRNEAARLTGSLMHSREMRRTLHRARMQRALVACLFLVVVTLTTSAFMPAPRYDYARGNHAATAASVCDSVQIVYSALKSKL